VLYCIVYSALQALDPSSDFPEAPLDSQQQLQAVADNQGPAGNHEGMQVKRVCTAIVNLA
jgi:hypothetical protein